jgi:hypothetical protein
MPKSLNKKEITKEVVATSKATKVKAVSAKKVITAKVVKPVRKQAQKPSELLTPKKSLKNVAAKKVAVKKATKKKKEKSVFYEPVEVVIPSTASLRLLEKVEIYKQWYQLDFPEYVSKTAKVAGYSFIFLGALFASFSYLNTTGVFSNTAALVCYEDTCKDIADSELPPEAPLVTFRNSIPTIISGDIDFSLDLLNASEVSTFLVSAETGQVTTLTPIEVTPSSNYIYLIKYSELTPGAYSLVAEVLDGKTRYKFSGSTFTVKAKVSEKTEPDLPLVEDSEISLGNENSTSTGSASSTDESLFDDVDVANDNIGTAVSTSEALPVSMRLEKLRESTFLKITTGNFAPERVNVYMQIPNSDHSVFLGLATLVQSEWIFSLDALELPSNTSFIFAEFTKEDVVYRTEGIIFRPNSLQTEDATASVDGTLLVEKVNLALTTTALQGLDRTSYLTILNPFDDFFNSAEEKEFASPALIELITAKMIENESAIDSLLFRYAASVQVSIDFVVQLAEKKLDDLAGQMAADIASDLGQLNKLTNVKTVIALRFRELKQAVTEEESTFALETNGLSARDTDFDGISDYDELSNFNTNYKSADTDLDGVLDSVELLVGTDPLESDVVEKMTFNQTTDDIKFSDSLSIEGISPLLVKNSKADNNLTYYVITGTAVPNSYVNVVAGEPGVIGIIKTNSEGQFSYTLEKELNNGARFAYLALPDNAGNPVATSKVYELSNTLGKQTASANLADIRSSTSKKDSLSHVVTAAVGVVSLGLILLLLSVSVRSRNKLIVQTK